MLSPLQVIVKWAPLLLAGFAFNIAISLMAMVLGTVAGLGLGLGLLSEFRLLAASAGSSRSSSATRPGWCCCSS